MLDIRVCCGSIFCLDFCVYISCVENLCLSGSHTSMEGDDENLHRYADRISSYYL